MKKKIISLIMLGSLLGSTGTQTGWLSDVFTEAFRDDRPFAVRAFHKMRKLAKHEYKIMKACLPNGVREVVLGAIVSAIGGYIFANLIAKPFLATKRAIQVRYYKTRARIILNNLNNNKKALMQMCYKICMTGENFNTADQIALYLYFQQQKMQTSSISELFARPDINRAIEIIIEQGGIPENLLTDIASEILGIKNEDKKTTEKQPEISK